MVAILAEGTIRDLKEPRLLGYQKVPWPLLLLLLRVRHVRARLRQVKHVRANIRGQGGQVCKPEAELPLHGLRS